ncbi:Cullin repeat-like-containing domain protein [Coprinopsis sp. MPI-PUGE-AT-0042]|nr:Cullin repeat-like-containing domain protein [Coprinopsis sp. MPI-PUGE-AT-0042]
MNAILEVFDTRIIKLEKDISPLYFAAQLANKRRANIDKVLAKIDDMSSTQADLPSEESLILRGPQPGQLHVYRDALERLNASIAFKGNDADTQKMASLVETGAKKLTQLYTKVVAEGSSGTTPVPGSIESALTSFPASLLPTLSPVVKFLRTLPLPQTHPSHPSAPAIQKTLSDALKGYADMRGSWAVKCLDGQGKRLVVRANEVDPRTTGREFGEWVELILGTAEEEYKLLQELSPLSSPASISAAFGALLGPMLRLFNTILTQLMNLSKKDLVKYGFLILSAYESLLSLQVHWEDLMGRTTDKLKQKNEFRDGLPQLKALCMRSFPEFIADLKMGASARSGNDTSVKLAPFVMQLVNYVTKVPEIKGGVSSALLEVGNGKWNMGAGTNKLGQVDNLIEGDDVEEMILQSFLHDVVSTAITSLDQVANSPALRRPAFGSIYLLNNIAYMRSRLLTAPSSRAIPAMFSSSTSKLLDSRYRIARAGYFDMNFTALIQTLSDDRSDSKSGGKTAAKEKFTRFFDLLDEVMERHRMARVFDSSGGIQSQGDEEEEAEERAALGSEVISFVIPTLQRFTQKQKDRDFSKNPQKYIRRTPEEVESLIRSVFG